MKHNAFTALSMAAALVVAGSAEAAEFEIDFEPVEGTDYALSPANGWTVQTGDASEVADAPSPAPSGFTLDSKVLSLDTGDEELIYEPDSTKNVSILTMDVCFVGADSAPTLEAPFTAKTALYLDTSVEGSPVLKATTDGTTWTNLTASVTEGQWYQVQMKFAGTEVEYFIGGTSVGKATLAAAFTKVTSVGFKGTGMVDNFVGDKAGIPGATTTDGTNETAGNSASYENGVVTGAFAMTLNGDDLEFIRVFDSNENYVTLRYSNSQAITLPAGFTPAKVVAYYGDDVSAVPDNMTVAAESVSVDTTGAQPEIKVEIDGLVSGVYYKLVDADTGTTIDSKLVAPAEEGGETVFSFAPAPTDWGVKKFKIVVSDDPPPAPASGN